jgi:drug/metabolite transporter (DMT)-like permease
VRRTEPLTPPRLVALALALAGIAVMVGAPSAGEIHPVGVGLALVSALLYAAYVPIIEHFDRRHGGAATATYAAAGATLAFVVGALAMPSLVGSRPVPATAGQWAAVGYLAVFATAIGFVVFLRGLAVIGLVRAAIVSTVEPFFTAVLAAILLGQRLTLATLAGGACVAAAVVLLQRAHDAAKAAAARTISIDPGVSDG